MPGPDAPRESDTERDGFLSYSREWHSLAVGAAAGLVGGLTYSTPTEPVGLAIMGAVVATAFGLQVGKRLSKKAAREVRKEPWYAVGALVVLFVFSTLLKLSPLP